MSIEFALSDYVYAHRGLWTPDGPPENSLAAFIAAADQGFGIELDIRLTEDGVPVCFHDDDLGRMTGSGGNLSETSSRDLARLKLIDGHEGIPTFDGLLEVWPINLPMLIELKATEETAAKMTQAVVDRLKGFHGTFAIMSFCEEAVLNVPNHIMRGYLIEPVMMLGDEVFQSKIDQGRTKLGADYYSIWHTDAEKLLATAAANINEFAVWTVKSAVDYKTTLPFTKAQIFEGFDPRDIV